MIDFDIASRRLHAVFYPYAAAHNDDYSVWNFHKMTEQFTLDETHELYECAKYMTDPVWRDEYIIKNTSK